jgi:hypothetical protein
MRIRSRAGNYALVGFGAGLLVVGVLAAVSEMRHTGRFEAGALIFVALFSLPGLWCIVGGAYNLRRLRERQPVRRSLFAHLVQADVTAIVVSAATALLCLAPEWPARLPRIVGALALYALLLALLAVPVLAAVALVARITARRRRDTDADAGP